MICPRCGHACAVIAAKEAAQALGSLGGKAGGAAKRRDVDYAALARLSHQKRRDNKAGK